MRVLLTAFGPFGSNTDNPSEHIVRRVAERSDVDVRILPVEFEAAREQVRDLGFYDVHLACGLASDRTVPTLERFAMNRQDSQYADNAGHLAAGEEIDESGPLAVETTLPFKDLVDHVRAQGIALDESLSAGLYVCNTVMYTAIQTSGRAGFLHVPPIEYLSIDDAVTLVEHILDVLTKEN